MSRRVLLIEPDYKNKYPPMGLMKIATYFRRCNDDVRFFKGDLRFLAARLLFEEFFTVCNDPSLAMHSSKLIEYIKCGNTSILERVPNFRDTEREVLISQYRNRYKKHDYPQFDIIGVTTLFTFYWKKTVDTINESKWFCRDGRIIIGGIAASILPEQMEAATGIKPIVGLLDKPGMIDPDNADIIDELPLDYSILEEVDYEYPAHNAYFGYMTRGCPRNCAFCVVRTLEPKYKKYISIRGQIQYIDEHFGRQQNLLLMDNNVFASSCFDKIIDEIKECGFGCNASYVPSNEYEVAFQNIKEGYNVRAYVRKMVKLYESLSEKLSDDEIGEFYAKRESLGLLYEENVTVENVLSFDSYVRPLYNVHFKKQKRVRYIDFNQGLDARLATDEKMAKLAEVNIRPLRVAFDHYDQKDIYTNAIRLAAKHGIRNLSNYLLYNFEDTPDELYYRMKINVDLCEELHVAIYSFPMKYHPISDPDYFMNRDYIGPHWNRKFIRAIQAVLNATKGKIGKGKAFFEEAFGSSIEVFHDILWMPEAFIIHRMKYKDTLTSEWRKQFHSLTTRRYKIATEIIGRNDYSDSVIESCSDRVVREFLAYYKIERDM